MKPNIIFIVSDAQRYDTFTPEIMPNLFEIAENGTVFNNAFTCNTDNLDLVLKTGQYISQRKFNKNKNTLDENEKSLKDYFVEEGYTENSFNSLEEATNYLQDKEKFENPFFMYLSNVSANAFQNEVLIEEGFNPDKIDLPDDLKAFKVKKETYNEYLTSFYKLDKALASLFDTLKNKKLFKKTVIIYTSNRGCHFNTRNKKNLPTCHESTIHIPLVIGGGAYKDVGENNSLISLIDIPTTLLDLADIYVPSSFFGNSLLPKTKEEKVVRKSVYIENKPQNAVVLRTEKYKISVSIVGNTFICDYFYDLSNDKNEKINLANDKNFKEIRKTLLKEISDGMETAFITTKKIHTTIKLKK